MPYHLPCVNIRILPAVWYYALLGVPTTLISLFPPQTHRFSLLIQTAISTTWAVPGTFTCIIWLLSIAIWLQPGNVHTFCRMILHSLKIQQKKTLPDLARLVSNMIWINATNRSRQIIKTEWHSATRQTHSYSVRCFQWEGNKNILKLFGQFVVIYLFYTKDHDLLERADRRMYRSRSSRSPFKYVFRSALQSFQIWAIKGRLGHVIWSVSVSDLMYYELEVQHVVDTVEGQA